MASFTYQELMESKARGLAQLRAPTHVGDGWVRINPVLAPFFEEDAPVVIVRLPPDKKATEIKPAV